MFDYPSRFLVLVAVFAVGVGMIGPSFVASATAKEPAAEAEEDVDFKTLKSPIPYSKKSISRGSMIFKRMCTDCHGPDGKGQMDVIADASDLTVPKRYYNGSTVGEMFRSIRDGAGANMPAYKEQLQKKEDLWHLVNYVQSLWPKDKRPQLQEEETDGGSTGEDDASSEGGGKSDG